MSKEFVGQLSLLEASGEVIALYGGNADVQANMSQSPPGSETSEVVEIPPVETSATEQSARTDDSGIQGSDGNPPVGANPREPMLSIANAIARVGASLDRRRYEDFDFRMTYLFTPDKMRPDLISGDRRRFRTRFLEVDPQGSPETAAGRFEGISLDSELYDTILRSTDSYSAIVESRREKNSVRKARREGRPVDYVALEQKVLVAKSQGLTGKIGEMATAKAQVMDWLDAMQFIEQHGKGSEAYFYRLPESEMLKIMHNAREATTKMLGALRKLRKWTPVQHELATRAFEYTYFLASGGEEHVRRWHSIAPMGVDYFRLMGKLIDIKTSGAGYELDEVNGQLLLAKAREAGNEITT